jgi:hypothetical protein
MNKINLVDLEKLFHRSKDRIKDLGEVFTPESIVEDMLDLLAKDKRGLWSDIDTTFFEPCCGHGNIVLAIYRRRLEAIYKKALSQNIKEAAYYAVANALNTLWAIDIDANNVEDCRTRVFAATLDFLKEKLRINSDFILISHKREFFAHVLSCIRWQVDENETLSALSSPALAKEKASLTKPGAKWLAQNGHHQLDFNYTWCAFFKECESKGTVPPEFERSLKFLEAVLTGKVRGFDEYRFVKVIIYA